MKIFSYVVDHDEGYAPNPTPPLCTLVHCKFAKGVRRNIIELADEGDWIIGTGGESGYSSGNGTLLYVMQVTAKMAFVDYLRDPAFRRRVDRHAPRDDFPRRFALVSTRFCYFGNRAPKLKSLGLEPAAIEKKGPGFRYLEASVLSQLLEIVALEGKIGDPCMTKRCGNLTASAAPTAGPAACRCSGSRNAACRARRRCGPSRRSGRRLSRAGLR